MNKTIKILEDVKRMVAAGNASEVCLDKLNEAIRRCEDKQNLLGGISEIAPVQESFVPSEGVTLSIQNATVNIYNGYPPTLE